MPNFLSRALIALLALSALPSLAHAQTPDPVVAAIKQLDTSTTEVRAIDSALDETVTADERRDLSDRLAAARSTASDTAATLQEQLDRIDARITELGPVTPGVAEASDIQAQRRLLAQQRSVIDSATKRGRLLAVDAQQLQQELQQSEAEALGKTISAQVASPVSPTFWSALYAALPQDAARVMRFTRDGMEAVRQGMRVGRPWIALLGLLLALVLLLPVSHALRGLGRRYAIQQVPGHRVRRSGYALWRLVVGSAVPGAAAFALVQGLRWSDLLDARWAAVVSTFVFAASISAFVAALGGALLMRGQGSWRLLPIDDQTATALRPWSLALAALALVDPLIQAFNKAIRASAAAHVAGDAAQAALLLLVVVATLITLGRLRAARRDQAVGDVQVAAHAGLALLTVVVWLVTLTSIGGLLLGYISFSLFLTRAVIVWPTIVVGTLYLLLTVTDDVATTAFSSTSRSGVLLGRGVGIRASAIDQFGVLLSGFLRIVLVVVAIGMLLTPFGAGWSSPFTQLSALSQGISVGEVTVSPGAILRSLLVLVVGMTLVRVFLRWLSGRYLPATELDSSARNSVALVARYIGILLAVLWGLASLGIGLERIALLLSALSVGIGFGLQAITQNFVSGLILLAERPVKIGDLVQIGAEEGDVKKISVRSTEIELADHSTLIVPNSELITKSIINKTLANPLGRIQLQFSVPLGTDPTRVRGIVLDIFKQETRTLDEPAPLAFIDGIADGRILFNCFAHVAGPRDVYPVRSAVLIEVLQRFLAEGIDIGTVPQRLEIVNGALTPRDTAVQP